jgi:tRNA G46 methylase TrmB
MTSVRALLAKYSISPAKRLGQHFLVDKGIIMAIIRTAQVNSGDVVVEVGPGVGEMTRLLASRAKRVIAIEVDESMVAVLEDRLAEYENIVLLRGMRCNSISWGNPGNGVRNSKLCPIFRITSPRNWSSVSWR